MANPLLYENTYWNHKGQYPELQERLQALVPAAGEVKDPDNNPALEKFRVASNCYYDLYNNGLCNMADEFEEVFDIPLHREDNGDEIDILFELTAELVNKTEEAINRFILEAAKEQGLQ